METSSNLQKSILSASFLKQPALCNQLLNKYIEFTTLLSNGPVQTSKPLVATMFEVKDFDMTTIDQNCSFKPIQITSIQSQNYILMSNIKLLSYLAIEMANSDAERMTQCTQCILNTFTNANLQIKSACLGYFSQLFKHTLSLNKTLQPMIVWILECIEDIENRILLWIHYKLVNPDDVEVYIKTVNDLLENRNILKLFKAEHLKQAIYVCLKILRTHQNLRVLAYDKIIPSVYALVKRISSEAGDEYTHTNMYQFVKSSMANDVDFQKNFELLGPVVLDQMKNAHVQSWYLADEKIQAILDHKNPSTEAIINNLKSLCSILKTVRYMEHNLIIHLQQDMCSKKTVFEDGLNLPAEMRRVLETHMDKLSRRLLPQLDALSKYVIQNFSLLLKSKYSPMVDTTTLLLFVEISVDILSVFDTLEIDEYLQSQLVLVMLSPFIRCSELLFNHFQQSFEEEIMRLKKIMESPLIRSNEAANWQEYVLRMIAGINFKYISMKNLDILMDILGQICTKITQPECLDQIINVFVSCVIQVNSYSISDLEKFIKSIASNVNNHLIIARHLCEFYCISSGQVYIFQKNKGNTYSYKVICPQCQTQFNFDGDEAEVFLQLLDKTNGKYVRNLTTKYPIQDKCHLNYFKWFKSNDGQIRASILYCLPSILNHLNLARYEEAIDYWLNPIVDNESDIRIWLIGYMGIFPKCGNQLVIRKCLEQLMQCTKKFLMSNQNTDQSTALRLISSFATSSKITEPMLLNCFRMILYFCMSSKSLVSRQAVLRANEICYKFGITPKNLLIWYKTDIFKLIVTLCVSNYISYNIGLQKSLQTVSKHMLFSFVDE